MEADLSRVMGVPCVITGSAIDIVGGKIDLNIGFEPDPGCEDTGGPVTYGGDATLFVTRVIKVPPTSDIGRITR